MLAMVVTVMLPEAFQKSVHFTGMFCVLGFLSALTIRVLCCAGGDFGDHEGDIDIPDFPKDDAGSAAALLNMPTLLSFAATDAPPWTFSGRNLTYPVVTLLSTLYHEMQQSLMQFVS